MSSVDLVFSRPPVASPGAVNLVFGETEVTEYSIAAALPGLGFSAVMSSGRPTILYGVSAALPNPGFRAHAGRPNDATLQAALPGPGFRASITLDSEYSIVAALPGLGFSAHVGTPNDAVLAAAMPAPGFAATVTVDLSASRPMTGQLSSPAQLGVPAVSGVADRARPGAAMPAGFEVHAQMAAANPVGVQARSQDSARRHAGSRLRHSEAAPLRGSWADRAQEMLRDRRARLSTKSQDAIGVEVGVLDRHQERYRDRRPSVRQRHQEAAALSLSLVTDSQVAKRAQILRRARTQDAMRPPPGMYVPPLPPGPQPCYTPDPHLVFSGGPTLDAHLVFVCGSQPDLPASVIVPVRRIYMALNSVSLRRVSGDIQLPALSMSLSIDVDSWTWGFNASLPYSSLAHVRRAPGDPPVELEANVNGTLYRVLAEKVGTSRRFADGGIRISGRGKSALLASPFAPAQTFSNATERTAQQLMADVLTLNGMPIGWDVDWQLADWLVPAGAFSHRGSYIDALNAIAGAAGAYLQPHPTDQQLRALLRYPVAPWNWGTVTPDFELPSSVTQQEDVEWSDKPEYNRVFVSGVSQGVLAQVTRGGTPGDLVAPMVADPLITHVAAARQRGLSVLSDTGQQALVRLRLPVLSETGVITPGKFVRYVDGGDERIGIVRSTGVDVSMPEVWQTLQVETHE